MDFIVDNAVWLSALLLLALVLVALLILGLSGLRLFRVLKATQKRAGAAAASLSAEADRLSAAIGARVRVLGVLVAATGEAADTLRAPLRYIGR